MTFWNIFFSVLAGIVAGTGINLCVGWAINRQAEKKDIKNLKFEIDFNIKKIGELKKEFQEYRNHLAAGTLNLYWGYFPLSRMMTVTMQQMHLKGTLYKHLSHEEITLLQTFTIEFSQNSEQLLNTQVAYNRDKFLSEPQIKVKADFEIRLFEERLPQSIAALERIKASLSK